MSPMTKSLRSAAELRTRRCFPMAATKRTAGATPEERLALPEGSWARELPLTALEKMIDDLTVEQSAKAATHVVERMILDQNPSKGFELLHRIDDDRLFVLVVAKVVNEYFKTD